MRYDVPDLTIEEAGTANERLGGVPLGLPPAAWPTCAECGKSQTLLAQLAHHPARLDLGREGRRLFVFQCMHDPGMCETWDKDSGANACLIVEPEALGNLPTPVPADDPPIDPAVAIRGWIERDDGIMADDAAAFYSDATLVSVAPSTLDKVTWWTRLGSVPSWIQSPDEAPAGWRFLGQLDSVYSFLDPPPPASWISADPERYEGRSHVAQGPNFGGGIAYLFQRPAEPLPEVKMFWQCG